MEPTEMKEKVTPKPSPRSSVATKESEKATTAKDILQNYSGLSSIFHNTSSEDLPVYLYELFESHNSIQTLITHETENLNKNKENDNIVLKEGSILSSILTFLLFGDLGKKYLQSILTQLLKDCINYTTKFYKENPVHVSTSDDDDTTWVESSWVMTTIQSFLEIFHTSANRCPLGFREVISLMYNRLQTEYPQDALQIMTRIVFDNLLCPLIADPVNHQLIDKSLGSELNIVLLSSSRCKSLCKLLSVQLKNFTDINQADSLIKQYMVTLMDKHMIKTIKDLIDSNTIIDNQSRAQQAINQMDLFLEQAKLGDRLGVQLKFEDHKIRLFELTKDNEGWWVASKSKKYNIVTYAKKFENSPLAIWKTVTSFRCTMKQIWDLFYDVEGDGKRDKRMSYMKCVQTYNNRRDFTFGTKPVFPIAAREFVFTRYENYSETQSFLVAFSIDRPDCPLSPKAIRGEILTSGAVIEVDEKDPGLIHFYHIGSVDLKGSIPKWIVNHFSGGFKDQFVLYHKILNDIIV